MKTPTKKTTNRVELVKEGDVVVRIYHGKRSKKGGGTRATYQVADYTSGERRLQFFSDHANAKAEATRIAGLISDGMTTAAQLNNAEAASYGAAVQTLRAAGIETKLELVASIHATAVKILGGDRIIEACRDWARRNPVERPIRTVRAVADEMIERQTKQKKSHRYLGDLRYQLNKICERFVMNIGEVTQNDLQAWFDSMSCAPRSIRNARSTATALFRFAEARQYIVKGENPALGTQQIEAAGDADIEVYTPDEVARLLAAAPETIRPLIAIQAFTGIRTAELMRMEWSAFKLERGHVEIKAGNAKTASRRIIPILPNLAEWLKPFAGRTGKLFASGPDYYHELTREVAASTKTDEQPAVELKHNGLRHSFVTYRMAQINNAPQVALEAGNSPQMIFKHYRELATADDAKEWFGIVPNTTI